MSKAAYRKFAYKMGAHKHAHELIQSGRDKMAAIVEAYGREFLQTRVLYFADVSGGPDACWPWTACQSPLGYGTAGVAGFYLNAQRLSYAAFRSPPKHKMVVDHLCRNRLCVNPAHLEEVTQRENVHRGEGTAGINARKTHCSRGHEFNSENTRYSGGKRHCRPCSRLRAKNRKGLK